MHSIKSITSFLSYYPHPSISTTPLPLLPHSSHTSTTPFVLYHSPHPIPSLPSFLPSLLFALSQGGWSVTRMQDTEACVCWSSRPPHARVLCRSQHYVAFCLACVQDKSPLARDLSLKQKQNLIINSVMECFCKQSNILSLFSMLHIITRIFYVSILPFSYQKLYPFFFLYPTVVF